MDDQPRKSKYSRHEWLSIAIGFGTLFGVVGPSMMLVEALPESNVAKFLQVLAFASMFGIALPFGRWIAYPEQRKMYAPVLIAVGTLVFLTVLGFGLVAAFHKPS
jgi:hypothetical protein